MREISSFSKSLTRRGGGASEKNVITPHVDLTVLSIFQKAVTFDHNLTH